MGNPMGGGVFHSSDGVAPPVDASSGTPVRHRLASLPCQSHFTPVGNWSSKNDRSRLSGAGGSPTECFRDYLSGHQGKEEEEEEVSEVDSVVRVSRRQVADAAAAAAAAAATAATAAAAAAA